MPPPPPTPTLARYSLRFNGRDQSLQLPRIGRSYQPLRAVSLWVLVDSQQFTAPVYLLDANGAKPFPTAAFDGGCLPLHVSHRASLTASPTAASSGRLPPSPRLSPCLPDCVRYNAITGVSTYEHPLDEHYRAYYRRIKEQRA